MIKIMHVVHQFSTGGLENGLVNIINHSDSNLFQHIVLSLKTGDSFANRLKRSSNVKIFSLERSYDQSLFSLPQIYRLLLDHRPQVLHTRNLPTIDAQLAGFMARVPLRIHSEHGWNSSGVPSRYSKHSFYRRFFSHLIHKQVALSDEICSYLVDVAGIKKSRVSIINNGVDASKARLFRTYPSDWPWRRSDFVIGTVGRLDLVKNHRGLVLSFKHLKDILDDSQNHLKLVIVGDGPEREAIVDHIESLGLRNDVWLAGNRSDVWDFYSSFDLFALTSIAEGMSNVILEAMAGGLPIIATNVGANSSLLSNGAGVVLQEFDDIAFAEKMQLLIQDSELRTRIGANARIRAISDFSLDSMIRNYLSIYSGN
jgi:sugar transferase (PEP-CTERM/EpsH1 system associated)